MKKLPLSISLFFLPTLAFASCYQENLPEHPCLIDYKPLAWSEPHNQDLPVYIAADSASLSLDEKNTLKGNVCIEQGTLRLESEQLDYNKATQELFLNDPFKIHHTDFDLNAKSGTYNLNNTHFSVQDIDYRLHPLAAKGHAESFSRTEDGTIHLKQAVYSTCQNPQQGWQIASRGMTFNPESGKATTEQTTFSLFGFKMLYLPSLSFSLNQERKNGFLLPRLKFSGDNGESLTLPYYVNIAPNYDLTISPRFMTRRGFQLLTETRYLTPTQAGELHLEWLPDDRIEHRSREAISWQHATQINPNQQFNVDFSWVSDKDYFDDLDDDLNTSGQLFLTQKASWQYLDAKSEIEAGVEGFQNLDQEIIPFDDLGRPYNRLPFVNYHIASAKQPLFAEFTADMAYFDRHDTEETIGGIPTRRATDSGVRLHIAPLLGLRFEKPYGFIEPSITTHITLYHLSKEIDNPLNNPDFPNINRNIQRFVPVYRLDSGLFFEKMLPNERFQSITLEPRLMWQLIPERSQNALPLFDTKLKTTALHSLFDANRFSGFDRIGDEHSVTLGLTSRAIDFNGRDLLRIGFGQKIFLHDQNSNRRANLNEDNAHLGPFLTELSYKQNKSQWDGLLEWDHQKERLEASRLQFTYQHSNKTSLSGTYNFRRDAILRSSNQGLVRSDLHHLKWAVSLDISSKINLLAGLKTDLDSHQTVEAFSGVEWQGCCTAWRLVWQVVRERDADSFDNSNLDHKIYFQFLLKGLFDLDFGSDQSLLNRELPGYDPGLGYDLGDLL